jgi:hypothetical protein
MRCSTMAPVSQQTAAKHDTKLEYVQLSVLKIYLPQCVNWALACLSLAVRLITYATLLAVS